jgi:hypothetical protein
MISAKTAAAALFGAFIGAWIGRAVFVWMLDVRHAWEIVAMLGLGLVGAIVCVAGEVEERRKRAQSQGG